MIPHGDPDIAWQQRFWSRVVEDGDTGCWLWTGNTNQVGPHGRGGYGRYAAKFGTRLAHRIAYMLVIGLIEPADELDHTCRVHRCVNPAHLEPVDHVENVMRGVGFGARNARKSHCSNGHAYTPENTRHYVQPSTGKKARCCRSCERNRARATREAIR